MSRIVKRGQISADLMIVVAVGVFTVSRLDGVFGSYEPKRVICEVYGPVGRVAAGALRCWIGPARDAGDRHVTDRLAKGV